jgi:hypothetical protein
VGGSRFVRASAPGLMLEAKLGVTRLFVVSPRRTLTGTGAHNCIASTSMSLAATAWRVPEPMAKFAREMGVIAKTTGEGDLAQRLASRRQHGQRSQYLWHIQ